MENIKQGEGDVILAALGCIWGLEIRGWGTARKPWASFSGQYKERYSMMRLVGQKGREAVSGDGSGV